MNPGFGLSTLRAWWQKLVAPIDGPLMMITGKVIRVSTNPPTSGDERGMPMTLMNTASPSSPNTIEGTAARLLMLTSMRSVQRLRGENSSR